MPGVRVSLPLPGEALAILQVLLSVLLYTIEMMCEKKGRKTDMVCDELFIDPKQTPVEISVMVNGAKFRMPEETWHLGEIHPGEVAPVAAKNKNLRPCGFFIEWGYLLRSAKKDKFVTTFPLHRVMKEPVFYGAFREHRCMIPVTCYYTSRKKNGVLRRYAVYPAEGDYMYLAGIYARQNDRPYMIIPTLPACEELSEISDQMPLILPRKHGPRWLTENIGLTVLMRSVDQRVRCELIEEVEC